MKNIKINKNEDKNNNMDFKELLNLVKNQENNKLNQDFSDIRKFFRKNTNGISQIKKIKSRKKI